MNKCSKCGAELPEDVKFCEKCGEGDLGSMLDLAVKYRDGKGLAKDVNRAFVLTYEAIAKGSKYRALCGLGYFYLYGRFAERDYKKANELFCRSANAGGAPGHYQLGKSYFEGRGVEKNLEAARFLFEKAIEKGSKDAPEEIKKIPDSVRSDNSGISGYTGIPDTSPLPDYVTTDYEKAKAGTLWTEAFKEKKAEVKCRCQTCSDKGTLTCPECGGKKEFECDKCHGKGHLETCNGCGSTGKTECLMCGGTGKVRENCPVCNRGKIVKSRLVNCKSCHGSGVRFDSSGYEHNCRRCDGRGQVEEEYEVICPNCHGDYKGFKKKTCSYCSGKGTVTCVHCNGTGKMTCYECNGKGKRSCKTCGGAGTVKCPECKKREDEAAAAKRQREEAEKRRKEKAAAAERERTRASYKSHGTFVTLGFLLGLMGVHFAYIGRWCLFLVQLALTGCGVAQLFVPSLNEHVQNWMMPFSMKLNELGWPWLGLAVQYPTLVLAGLWCLWGILFVTKDGTNHKMERSPNVNLVMYVLTFILQVWLLFKLADVKWPKTLTWGILETVGAMIILNLHFLFASQATHDKEVHWVLVLNVLLTGLAAGMNVFLPGSVITLVIGVAFVVIYLLTSFKAGTELER